MELPVGAQNDEIVSPHSTSCCRYLEWTSGLINAVIIKAFYYIMAVLYLFLRKPDDELVLVPKQAVLRAAKMQNVKLVIET